ncbi:hypothetical protein AB0P12_25715 [Streptomyces subrutilus]|uniref:hypothetical protein n=1 Tax=Streptomyces subrutilus TaxID=36818 RepID=UPI00340ECF9D
MIMLSADPTSEGFATGQTLGALLATGMAMAVLWFATRAWRRGPVPAGAMDAERASAVALRRGNVVRALLLVFAAAGLVRAFTFQGEPSAAEVVSGVQDSTVQAPAEAAGTPQPQRAIGPAPEVGAYRLLTGEAAANYDELTAGKGPSGKRWYYDGPGGGPVDVVLQINTVEWDARLAESKRSNTIPQELNSLFTGARATEVTDFEAGPWGGRLSCGFLPSAGDRIVCAWADAATSGQVALADEKNLSEAASIAMQFRTASEKRT